MTAKVGNIFLRAKNIFRGRKLGKILFFHFFVLTKVNIFPYNAT